MEQLKIVIISRHLYPKQSPRSFRTTDLALELARRGHSVTVYTLTGKYNYKEFSKKNNLEVRSIGHIITGLEHSDGTLRNNLIDKMLRRLLQRLIEYPLIKLAFKIPAILKKETNIDLLITIAHPHTIHWGTALAKKINKNFPSKWISDCGDPYMGDPANRKKYYYFKFIEKFWCNNTDFTTVPTVSSYSGYYPEFHAKIRVIPQGYDFTKTKISEETVNNQVPTFAYAGSIYPKYRDPTKFLNYISTLNINFKFIVYTNNFTFFSVYSKQFGDKLMIIPTIERSTLIFELSKVDFLVNFINNSDIQVPSKLIDYALTRRPVISISTSFPTDEMERFNEFEK